MVGSLSVVLAALLSVPPRAPLSSDPLPGVCDEANAADVESEPAVDEPLAVEPLTPSVNCSEPPPVPAVVDCNDKRMSVWVQEMIGTCDMPRTASSLGARPARERPSAMCNGAGCGNDASPLRAATRDHSRSPWIASARQRFNLVLESAPLDRAGSRLPRSALPSRLERPPRV